MTDKYYTILSIDIGMIHLGMSVSVCWDDWRFREIRYISLIDLTEYTHENLPQDCHLYHTKNLYDRILHVVEENKALFSQADYILIERQPPQGFVSIEQIIFGFFRDKAILISPNSVHKFHKFEGLDYDQRKIASEIVARQYLVPQMQEELDDFDRFHDVTDSILQMIYWLDIKNKKYIQDQLIINQKQIEKMKVLTPLEISIQALDRFKYNPN